MIGAIYRAILPRRFQAFCIFAESHREHKTFGEIRRAWKKSMPEDAWLNGRYAAFQGWRRRWFASAAWKRGYSHGRQELRVIKSGSIPSNLLPPDLRDL